MSPTISPRVSIGFRWRLRGGEEGDGTVMLKEKARWRWRRVGRPDALAAQTRRLSCLPEHNETRWLRCGYTADLKLMT